MASRPPPRHVSPRERCVVLLIASWSVLLIDAATGTGSDPSLPCNERIDLALEQAGHECEDRIHQELQELKAKLLKAEEDLEFYVFWRWLPSMLGLVAAAASVCMWLAPRLMALNAGIPPCAVCVIAKMYHDACGPAHGWLPYVAFGVMALFSGQLFMLAYDGQRGQWAMRLGGGAQQPGPGVANTQLLVGR